MKNLSWYETVKEIAPLNRALVSHGINEGYSILGQNYQIEMIDFESGRIVNGWEIPPLWTVKQARIIFVETGEIILDFEKENPLCLFTYSPPFEGVLNLKDLKKRILSDPNLPNDYVFHFRNGYNFNNPEWGFSIPFYRLKKLKEGEYKIKIDTEYTSSKMKMAHSSKIGEFAESILFVGHFDHPAQVADGLLGCVVGHEIIKRLKDKTTKFTYRMLSCPEIIGSVYYSEYFSKEHKVKEAMFCATSGINAPIVFCNSAQNNSIIEKLFSHVKKYFCEESKIVEFRESIGNDEISFDVPGVNIPCTSMTRWPYNYYHRSSDSIDKISINKTENFIDYILSIIFIIENNATIKLKKSGLPKLSYYDVYLSPNMVSGFETNENKNLIESLIDKIDFQYIRDYLRTNKIPYNKLMTLVMALSDGKTSILNISERTNIPFHFVFEYCSLLEEKNLITLKWINPLN